MQKSSENLAFTDWNGQNKTPTAERADATKVGTENLPPKVAAKIRVDGAGCWLWTGARWAKHHADGYGCVSHQGRNWSAHRLTYTLLIGPIPEGSELDHLCRNTLCCNPAHLEPVTHQVNVRRGVVSTHNRVKTHCPKGHPYSGDNLYVFPNGARHCRTCQKESAARSIARRKAAEAANLAAVPDMRYRRSVGAEPLPGTRKNKAKFYRALRVPKGKRPPELQDTTRNDG